MNAPVQHQNRAHARLGGSAASIFTVCTGAPALWAGRQRKATSFTRYGTLAHELSEKAIKGQSIPGDGVSHCVEGEMVMIDQEMLLGVKTYTDLVKDLVAQADWHAIEMSFDLDDLWSPGKAPEPMFGTADFVAVIGDILVDLDLKMGKGIPVSAEGQAQLLYYALGVFLKLRREQPDLAAEIAYVRVGICQPRIRDDVDWWDIPLVDLLLWGDNVLKKSVDAIQAGTTTLKAGKHCQFCVAKPVCPALAEAAMQAAKGKFPPPDPVNLSDAELGEALDKAELLSMWHNALRVEAETRLRHGKDVSGWKMVDKRGYRQWTSESAVGAYLKSYLPEGAGTDFMTTPELVSPAQAEKRLKAHGFPKNVLDQFITTPTVGATMVPASDKRPAVQASPLDVFPDDAE